MGPEYPFDPKMCNAEFGKRILGKNSKNSRSCLFPVCKTKDDMDITTSKPPNPNQACVFPFKWMNKEYTKCTMDNHDQFWCGTQYDVSNIEILSHGVLAGWGNCVDFDACPKEEPGRKDDLELCKRLIKELDCKGHILRLCPDLCA